MSTITADNYVRLHLLNVQGCTPVLREVFLNEVKTSSASGNVDIYLTHFRSDIDALKKRTIISKPAYTVLFPGHGKKTDIEEWDVSLLCLILIHCCSFGGSLLKLKDVFNAEVQNSGLNDVDLFLQANKKTISTLKGTEITDGQYNELFPPVHPTCLDKWDTSTLLCILLNLCQPNRKQKVLDILRDAIKHAVELYVAKLDIDFYLKEKMKPITDLRQNGSITQTQFNQLFPENGDKSDIYTWDNSLLCTIFLKVCKPLSQTTVEAVKTIRSIRNEHLAHKGHAEISDTSFLESWTDLNEAITTILVLNVPSMKEEIKETISKLSKATLDIQTSIEILKQHYLNDQQTLKKLEDIERNIHMATTVINQCVKDTGEGISSHIDQRLEPISSQLKALMDALQSKDGRKIEIPIGGLRAEVNVSYDDKDAVEEALQYIKDGIKRRQETESSDSLMQSVGKFARGIEEHDAKIVDYSDGLVILHLQCESIAGLFTCIQYFKSEEMHDSIMRIQFLLRRKFARDFQMALKLNEEDIQKLLEYIESQLEQLRNEGEEQIRRSVCLLLECNSWDGMLEVWNMFNSGNASSELNILSEELSKRLGKAVKVTAFIPFDEVRSSLPFQRNEEIQKTDMRYYLTPAPPSDEELFNKSQKIRQKENPYAHSPEGTEGTEGTDPTKISTFPDTPGGGVEKSTNTITTSLIDASTTAATITASNKSKKHPKSKMGVDSSCSEGMPKQLPSKRRMVSHRLEELEDKQDHQVQSTSRKSSTEGETSILQDICNDLMQKNWVLQALPVKRNGKGTPLVLCYTNGSDKDGDALDMYNGISVIYRDFKSCSRKSLVAEKSMMAQNASIPGKWTVTLNTTISKHTDELMAKHSNLEMIGMSLIRSTERGNKPEPCIVLYCRSKAYVPAGEKLFPKELKAPDGTSIKTDVREGFFMLCPKGGACITEQSVDWQKELSLGHSIGPDGKNVSATLGIFVTVHARPSYNAFLTASHLFFKDPANADLALETTVVQPADGESQTKQIARNRMCGTVKACIFNCQGETGIDVALVQIADERMPERTTFVAVSIEALDKAGFSLNNYPTFDDGSTKNATDFKVNNFATERVIKFGKETGLTKGTFRLKNMAVKTTCSESEPLCLYNKSYVMKGQLVIESPIKNIFFQEGDSGSAVFLVDKDNTLHFIGMAIGITTDGDCIVTPIEAILKKLSNTLGQTVTIKTFDTEKMH